MEVYIKSIGKQEFLFLGEKHILALSQITRLFFEESKQPDGKTIEYAYIAFTDGKYDIKFKGEEAAAIRHFFQSKPVEPYPYR